MAGMPPNTPRPPAEHAYGATPEEALAAAEKLASQQTDYARQYAAAQTRYAEKLADTHAHETFTGGGMRETHGDRPRFELLMPEGVPYDEQLLTRCAVHLAKGASKYAARNWEQFSDKAALEHCRASAHRHLMQWLTDTHDGEDHAAAVFFNLLAAENILRKLRLADEAKYPLRTCPAPGPVLGWPARDTSRD